MLIVARVQISSFHYHSAWALPPFHIRWRRISQHRTAFLILHIHRRGRSNTVLKIPSSGSEP
jgi:hypothetical protein